jgi:hypothetical protein
MDERSFGRHYGNTIFLAFSHDGIELGNIGLTRGLCSICRIQLKKVDRRPVVAGADQCAEDSFRVDFLNLLVKGLHN